MNYLIYILIGVVGFVLGRQSKSSFMKASEEELEEMRGEAKKALTKRTERRKEKILDFMKNEAKHQKELKGCNLQQEGKETLRQAQGNFKGITCLDAERLLDVSGKTARKYLNELESECKIKQIGETGRSVYYVLST